MTATITPIRGYRLNNTPKRWQKALRRALAEGVEVRQLATTGVWIATSGTNPEAAYVVTTHDCECRAAAEGDVCCKHRALLRHALGDLPLEPDPEPEPPAAAAAPPEAEEDAYARGFAQGARTNYGLVAADRAALAGWERIADPVRRAYHRGFAAGLDAVALPAAA
jgi:hypothetical protein